MPAFERKVHPQADKSVGASKYKQTSENFLRARWVHEPVKRVGCLPSSRERDRGLCAPRLGRGQVGWFLLLF